MCRERTDALKKALIFFDFDITIRHFIHSSAFRKLEESYDVTYVFHRDSSTDFKPIHSDVSALGLNKIRLLDVPRKRMGEWYHVFLPGVFGRHRGTPTYAAVLDQARATHTPKMFWAYRTLSLPIIRQLFTAYMRFRMGKLEQLESLLDEERPDIIFHPSLLAGYFINDLTIACRKRRIPFVPIMNSWDNPSNKAMSVGKPSKLVVWGPQSRDHAKRFLGLSDDDIEMLGVAQFDIYRKPVTESREELAKAFGVPADIPIVLFGGASKSFNETAHLQIIDAAIEAGEIPPCHVLYRPHPWRGRLVDGEISLYEANLKNVSLDPHMEDFYRSIIDKPNPALYLTDYDITRRLMKLIDAMVSPLSTILLEAVMHDKPVLALFVDADPFGRSSEMMEILRRLPYFADFVDNEGILTCDALDDIAPKVAQLLANVGDPEVIRHLREHADFFVARQGDPFCDKIVELADRLTS